MATIEDKDLKPCQSLFTRLEKDGFYVNLKTRCKSPKCYQGCFDGTSDCKDYVRRKRITAELRNIASQIEKEA